MKYLKLYEQFLIESVASDLKKYLKDEYKDLEDETVSLGHFSTLQGATDQNSLLDELYFGDGDIKENKD